MAKFRVRARTVDMLGRQQIAGVPTAISELFKNAHDAYARNVEVDYFRDDGLFVLRDDGLGMTRDDFEQRWLTLGTESKLGSGTLKSPPRDPGQVKRPVLGEKGIGRLAIAIIGPQVLVLSRAKVNGQSSDTTVAAYLHWRLFELPGIDLEEVTVPVREFPGGTLPDASDVQMLVDEVEGTLDDLAKKTDKKTINTIRDEMRNFKADPLAYSQYLGPPDLTGAGCGTHFYIIPADSIINDDIDNRQSQNKATRFEKNLIGFTNTMTPNHSEPPIVARFRDHRDDGAPIELIGDRAFFTPKEYQEVDHHFIGKFDEYGQFQGSVGLYQMEPEQYVLSWNEADGRKTECGPFNLTFAYMQGVARDSLVPPGEHARLRGKLDRHGGLYIYRDGVRVQPYGDSDYDWLDIERNRTLGAAYYFYSHRRMFGTVELSHSRNFKLTEKAGREGFRENKAYRQLRSILMNFFLQTAGDFFREEGKYAEARLDKKSELNRAEEIRRKKAKQSRARKATFSTQLDSAFDAIDQRRPETEAEATLNDLKRKVSVELNRNTSAQQKALALMRLEKAARGKLYELRLNFSISKPRGVGLSRDLNNQWLAYVSQIEQLDAEVFNVTEKMIEKFVATSAEEASVPLDDVARINAAVDEVGGEVMKSARKLRGDVNHITGRVAAKVRDELKASFKKISQTVDSVHAELERLQRSSKGIEALSEVRERLVSEISSTHAQEKEKLEALRGQLVGVERIWSEEGGFTSSELTEALEEELDELKSRRDSDLELAQIGMALNTISHEFDRTVGALRDGLRRLKAWADANPDLEKLYGDIRVSFDHLDEYLSLFTPLDRRLHRTRIEISGKEIFDFLSKLFGSRLERHKIKLTATSAFLDTSMQCYPSSLYPPFVNLVDNAIFWLQSVHDRSRALYLDADDGDFLVRDNGPGVSVRDRDNIFSMNFSRKPGGRGMGLHISRETLERVGLELTLAQFSGLNGATFRIGKSKNSVGGPEYD